MGQSGLIHSRTTILPAESERLTFLPVWSSSVNAGVLGAGSAYFTEQPYGCVRDVETFFPSRTSSSALATWLAGDSALPRGSSSMAPL